MSGEDRDLLVRTRRGHDAAARALWARHGPRLAAYARVLLRDASAAEDAVQDVFCAIMTTPTADLRRVEDVAAYLTAMTRRRAISMLRSSSRRARRQRDRGVDAGSACAGEAMGPMERADVSAGLRCLPRRLLEVLTLVHAGGLTLSQIERATGIPKSTLGDRYARALEAMAAITGGAEVRS